MLPPETVHWVQPIDCFDGIGYSFRPLVAFPVDVVEKHEAVDEAGIDGVVAQDVGRFVILTLLEVNTDNGASFFLI